MARDHQIKGDPYHECDICGKTVRLSDTTEQRGFKVCSECVDSEE